VAGTVLWKPPHQPGRADISPPAPPAVARRRPLPDGRSIIRLRGVYRFSVERELDGRPYRQAIVRPLARKRRCRRPALRAVRDDLMALAELRREMGGLPADGAASTRCARPASKAHHRLAAQIDLLALRK
jgi:Lon protease-like protein